MNDLLNRALGLDSISFGAEGVEFAFERPIPAWGWLLAVVLAVLLAWWSYRRLRGGAAGRAVGGSLRALLLLLLVFLIAGPQLVRPNERVERDWVVFLVDRSASLTIPDVAGDRDTQLRAALAAAWPQLATMAEARTVVWLGFDGGVFDLAADQRGIDLGPADGPRTSLGRAIDQALQRAAARRLAGLVVLSDGRSVDDLSRAARRRLEAERIAVYSVPLGSDQPLSDLALADARAPDVAFISDAVPVRVSVERLGDADAQPAARLQLVDAATGIVLDERRLEDDDWTDDRAELSLTTTPDRPGHARWIVRLVPDGRDLLPGNNQRIVDLELVDRPIRVAYFDGYPRWEQHYLAQLLLRERTIASSALMLAPNRRFTQQSDVALDSLPRSPEEWAPIDVIIMGDVSPGMFTSLQLEQIREHVAQRGAGLLWIAGEAHTPGAWRGTALADLLPFTLDAAGPTRGSGARAFGAEVLMDRAPAAERLGVLELGDPPTGGWPARLTSTATGWATLRYAQVIDPSLIKPTAETLAIARAVDGQLASRDDLPLVLAMRYGAGRVIYVATDEIWRWRYARGEALPERFWIPLIRLQARESLARSGRPATIEVSPRRAEVERPVRIAVDLLDQSLVDNPPARIALRLVPEGAARREGVVELTAVPERTDTAARRAYDATWIPAEPGRYRVEIAEPSLAALGVATDLVVTTPDDEMRWPQTDHPRLERISEQTGGVVIEPSRLGTLPAILPNRAETIAGIPDVRTLWDKPAALLLLVLLAAAEWVVRRLIRLS